MPYSQKSSQVDVFKQSTSLSVASIPLFYQQTVEKTVSKHTHNSCFQQTTFEQETKKNYNRFYLRRANSKWGIYTTKMPLL